MILNTLIEMPADTTYKYEKDKTTGELVLDRVLNVRIPFNYGYVANTLASDGDPLDVFVISKDPITPLALAKASVFGVFLCRDQGVIDHKLIAILSGEESRLGMIKSSCLLMIKQYLQSYKEGFEVLDYKDLEDAKRIYNESVIK